MDDCGAILHNIETKWLYDFLTLEKCRNFSQAAVSRNVSQPAFSRRIRALEQAIGVELFNCNSRNKVKYSIRRSAICCNS